ncbi:MAG: hypothetical protein RIS41_2246 [Actinomycetota bacterium]
MNQSTITGLESSARRSGARFDGIRRSVVEPLRRRRVRVPELAIGIFVIAAAVAVSVVLNTGDDEGTGVLAVARPLARGQVIDTADLTAVSLTADRGVALLSTDLSTQVIGMRAAVDIGIGTPLSSSHLIDVEPLSTDDAVVGVVVDDSHAPAELAPGDLVRVVFLDTSLENGDVVSALPNVAEVWAVTVADEVMGERSISLRVARALADSFVGHDEIHLVKVVK